MTHFQQRKGSGLRTRLLVAFLSLSLLPLLASNSIGFGRSRTIVEGLVQRYLQGVASLQSGHIQEQLQSRSLYLDALATSNAFLQRALTASGASASRGVPTQEAIGQYLSHELAESALFGGLSLWDSEGRFVASTGSAATDSNSPDLATLGLSLVPTGPETPPILRYNVPVLGEGGVGVGFLVATVPLGRGVEFLEIPEHVAGAIESFILDERGRPVFVSHQHGHLAYDRPLVSPLTVGSAARTARYTDREGVEVVGASSELPEYGWRFVAEVPVDDALVELRGLRSLSKILSGVFSLIVVVAAWLLAAGIVAPVQRLVRAARRLGLGDLDVRVEPQGDDEIAELSGAFNEMAGQLAATQDRIERLHRSEIQRAEQLATVGEVASGVAHEIKNPVVSISNGLDLVMRHVEDQEELRPITVEMKRQLQRIEQAIRDLLAFARPPEPSFRLMGINEAVERAATLVEPRALKGGVSLNVVPGRDIPEIRADADLLVQAIVNLLINAIQFSKAGDVVWLRTLATREGATVRVEDQGPGMDERVMSSLFKPFFTTRHTGTGLGLSITSGIMEQHAGRVAVESIPGEGSTFVLIIPTPDKPRNGRTGDE